jgi:hypothetical protein
MTKKLEMVYNDVWGIRGKTSGGLKKCIITP